MEDTNIEGMRLHLAVRNGDINEVESCIKQNDDVNKSDQSGATPLHVAAEMGHTAIAGVLLRSGAVICRKDDNGRTAIHNAAMSGHTMTLEDILGAASLNIVNEGDNGGMTALHWTAENSHTNALKVLCEKGADVNKVTKYGRTSIHWAAEKGNIEGIGILVKQGANINAVECDDRTPLHLAVMNHHSNAVLALIKEGADVRQGNKYLQRLNMLIDEYDLNTNKAFSGDTALHIAASMNDIEAMKVLINCGANVNDENKLNKRTPLIFAAMNSHNDSMSYLIGKGANLMIKDKSGKSPLHWVAEKNNVVSLESLLNNGGDVNAVEWGGNTPLHIAALNGHTDAVRILVTKGDNVNKTNDTEQRTPLHAAAENGHVDAMEVLLLAGAIVNSTDKKLTTPLHLASEYGHIQSVKLLLQHNATVNAKEKTGDTPLHLAAHEGHIASVQQLLSSGIVDTSIRNVHGHTPLMEAKCAKRNSEIVVMLISSYNDFPVHLFKKVVITGSTAVGKSTLAQVIGSSSKTSMQRKQVLAESTSGIVPHVIENENVVLFDTSGLQNYYCCQLAYLKSILSVTPAVFLVVYNSRSDTEEIQMQLYHWLQMIAVICHGCPQKSSVILAGTHAKGINKKKRKALSTIAGQIMKAEWNIVLEGSVYIDPIDLPSQYLQEMFDLLYRSTDAISNKLSPVSCECHLLYSIIKNKLCGDSVSLTELHKILQEGPQSSILGEISDVTNHLSVLAERGFIIFIKNEHHSKSCIVFNTGTVKLLSNVIGIIFGSEICNHISNPNGIVAVSAMEKLFSNLGIAISTITQFLIELELCLQIDEICEDSNIFPNGVVFTPSVLFPSLISSSICRPDAIEFATHYFGLLISPDDDENYFPPCFLQFLMVRLLTMFCIQKTLGHSVVNVPCKVWNQGIHWNTQDGASITVEITDQFRSLYLIMTLPNCSNYMKQISFIQAVKHVLHGTCPYLSITEAVVDPNQARIVFTRGISPHLLVQVMLPLLKEAISNDKLTVPAVCTGDSEVKLSDWTSMEPNLVTFIRTYPLSS